MKIGIMTAMSSEYEQLAKQLTGQQKCQSGPFQYIEGKAGNNTIILLQCGIGKVNAAAGAMELIRTFHPDCLISTGVAGGIDTRVGVMDVVVSRQIVYHDVWCGIGNEYGQIQGMPPRFSGNDVLLSCALNLTQSDSIASQIPAGMKIHDGLICTGDQFITDRVDLDAIKERFSEGLAVDMESAAIAQVCYLYEIPFLSFRIISDTPGVDSHIQQYENFWGEMADRSFRITELFLNSLPEKI